MTIIPALENYYAVSIDKSSPKIVVTETSIIAWNLATDADGNVTSASPITIHGQVVSQYIGHPTGVYTDVQSGIQYKDRDWFVQVLQADWDEHQKGSV